MVLQADMASSRGEKMSAFFPREQNLGLRVLANSLR